MSINPTTRRPKHPMDMGSLVFWTSKDWSIQILNAEGKPVILGGTRRRTWTEIVNVAEGMHNLGLTFRLCGVPGVWVTLYLVSPDGLVYTCYEAFMPPNYNDPYRDVSID